MKLSDVCHGAWLVAALALASRSTGVLSSPASRRARLVDLKPHFHCSVLGLSALVASADLVVFPVDCIDHDSVASVKRECERQRIAYHPLRTSSAAAFAVLVTRLASALQGNAQSA